MYDAACGLCAASVQFVLRRDRRGTLRFAALDSNAGSSIRARHPSLAGVDSMVWVEPSTSGDRVLMKSSAALRVARYIGGPWRLAALAYLIPPAVRDAAYDVIARHRHRLTRGGERCFLPTPSVRARFLS